jgi:hypothetical protein
MRDLERHAYAIGRNALLSVSEPTRRTSTPCFAASWRAAFAWVPRSARTSPSLSA